MTKINPAKTIQRYHTEAEMRQALADFCTGNAQTSQPPQDDDSAIILQDCIEEVLELRSLREKVRGFAQSVAPELARR